MEKYTLKSHRGKLTLFATILASGMAFLDGTVVNIAIPQIQSKLHAAIGDILWVVNAYALLLSALILISGSLGDKFGRKKIFLYGICLFTLASLLCSLSQTVMQLIFLRGLQGIGAAMMVPGSLSIIDSSFEESIRGRAIGLWSGLAGGVAALGPFLGGFLVQTFGWPAIFYINVPLGILAFFITLRCVPETKDPQHPPIDYLGTISIFFGLLGLTYALISAPTLGWYTLSVILSFIGGVIFSLVFVIVEMKSKHPLVPLEIFRSKLVLGANLVTFFLYFALGGVIFFLVLNLQQLQHLPPLMAGIGLLPSILLITFLSGPAGGLADKIGPRIPMIIGPVMVGIGMGLFIIPGLNANYFVSFLPGLILFGLGMSLVIAPLTKSALSVNTKFSGSASGVNNAVARVAGLMAVALLGAIILSIFSASLQQSIMSSTLGAKEKQEIMVRKNQLAAIEIPQEFSQKAKTIARTTIDTAFLRSFRWAMGINAFLAIFSAGISFIFIRPKEKS